MLYTLRTITIIVILQTALFADVFMSELTDPQNSSDAGRYVELYNNGDSDVDLSAGWQIQRWTNGNADPTSSSLKDLTGTIAAGGFYIICNDADKFAATYGGTCDQDIGTGGAADSNGDDNVAIMEGGAVIDIFGVPGEDGSGTGHEFEDGRAERSEGNQAAANSWSEDGWNVDNDSGGGDGNQYAPEGFDPGAWIGAEFAGGDDGGDDCASGVYDCAGVCDGASVEDSCGVCDGGDADVDCFGVCFGGAEFDACGECGGQDFACSVGITVSVDMSVQGVVGDIKVRTSTVDGEYSPSDWYLMEDLGDGVYSHELMMVTGVTYGYNFNNSDGSGYESGDGLADCAGGNYGNDRFVTAGDADTLLDTVCWESCDACPEDIPGCMDPAALNYDPAATSDDGSCFYNYPETANIFFSEYAEGSSNNKYLEIFNNGDTDVDLSGYSLSSCSNGCDDGVSWDYPDNVGFDAGTTVAAGDVYVVCHGSADDVIQAECDQTFTYLSNGDDVFALTQVGSGVTLDIIGQIGDDPGSGWEVAGVSNATKDHTLVRKSDVASGNGGDWASSAGTDADGSEWIVYDQNTWENVGWHTYESAPSCDAGDLNFDGAINVLDVVTMVEHIVNGDGSVIDCSDINDDGIVNILDVVNLVDMIMNGRVLEDATSATLIKIHNSLRLSGNGYIGGIEMTISHENDFSISLTDKALVAQYRTDVNTTKIVIVNPVEGELFTTLGDYEILDVIVANSSTEIDVSITMPTERLISSAYPNPFNPVANIDFTTEVESNITINVYNVQGQLLSNLVNQSYSPGSYSVPWDANSYSSGMYFIEINNGINRETHQLVLMK